MKKISMIFILLLMIKLPTTAYAAIINETDTELSESLKYALILSLSRPISEAIEAIYKNDKAAPKGLTWAAYQTEILKIKQANGIGGIYELTLKVYPYYLPTLLMVRIL